jgi:hypothetical protein
MGAEDDDLGFSLVRDSPGGALFFNQYTQFL